tara:strand:+ start:317 stop:1081 length:765 start_codon:yes stop_codon:yes gene_type:complete
MTQIKIGVISDLHTRHEEWFNKLQYDQWGHELYSQWKDLDILIFAGDCSSSGLFYEIKSFVEWFSKQPAKHKIMIAGNHDYGFEDIAKFDINVPHNPRLVPPTLEEIIPDNVIYLNDESIEVLGLNIWGSPIQPYFGGWAFNRFRSNGEDIKNGIKQHWDLIPDNTDILITHGPPRGILDLLSPKFRRHGENPHVGCDDLLQAISRVKPRINVFGHIHEGYGHVEQDGTHYFNASCLDDNYSTTNPPQFITLDV